MAIPSTAQCDSLLSKVRARASLVVLVCTLASASLQAQADVSAVVVSGIGGVPEYSEAFDEQARVIGEALATLSRDTASVTVLNAPDRDTFLDAVAQAASSETDLFALVLIGHGSNDARSFRFNLPGPDPVTEDLVAALTTVKAQRQLVVVATSASGAVLDALAQPGRVVVTATRSGAEVNLVRFPRFFAEALEDTRADLDRNEILTLAEAWRYTTSAVREYYESESLLASEHPELRGDDSNLISLARLGSLAESTDNPVVLELLDQRLELEGEFAALKSRRDSLARADYYIELETLLLKIARLQITIDEETGWSDSDAES